MVPLAAFRNPALSLKITYPAVYQLLSAKTVLSIGTQLLTW